MALKKNKLGVENSLVNNINAKKKAGTSKSKEESTVSKKAYSKMESNWGKKKPSKKAASTSSAVKSPAKKVAKKPAKKATKKS